MMDNIDTIIFYIAVFGLFSFVGSVGDFAYRFLETGKPFRGMVIPWFAPPYGFAAVSLLLIFQYVPGGYAVQILLGTIACDIIELLSGIFCVKMLGRRIWDYSKNPFNLWGHIDLLHTVYWAIATAMFRWSWWWFVERWLD